MDDAKSIGTCSGDDLQTETLSVKREKSQLHSDTLKNLIPKLSRLPKPKKHENLSPARPGPARAEEEPDQLTSASVPGGWWPAGLQRPDHRPSTEAVLRSGADGAEG